jgi:DNA repair exonuclease SbcCD nuclease subunit
MKIAILTDTHAGVRNSNIFFMNNQRKFYEQVFFPEIDKRGIKTVLHGGDFWEDRKQLNTLAIKTACEMYYEECEKRGIKQYQILGNHDVMYRNTNEIHSMDIFEKAYKQLTVIQDTAEIELGGKVFALMSWINNENLESRLDFIKNTKADVLLGHLEVKNFEMTAGNVCEHGLDQEILRHIPLVLSGHFHLATQQGNIKYLGNNTQTNRGDLGQKKGFWIIDTDDLSMEFIHNPYDVYNQLHFDNDINIMEFDVSPYQDQIVVVYIKSYLEVNQKKLNLYIDKLNRTAHSVTVQELHQINVDSASVDVDIEAIDTVGIINSYIDSAIEQDEQRPKIKNMMHDLYKEALNNTVTIDL